MDIQKKTQQITILEHQAYTKADTNSYLEGQFFKWVTVAPFMCVFMIRYERVFSTEYALVLSKKSWLAFNHFATTNYTVATSDGR